MAREAVGKEGGGDNTIIEQVEEACGIVRGRLPR
jgi:hypothetical protein